MHSHPTLTGLPVERDERPMPYAEKKMEVECNHPLIFFWSCWRAEQTFGMPKDLRGPKTGLRHKPLVITKAKERKSLENLFGSSARSGSHHLCFLFEEIFKNQIMLELYDTNQISWAIILTLTFYLAHSFELIITPCLSFLTNRNGCIQITLTWKAHCKI